MHGAAQPSDVGGAVGTLDAGPAVGGLFAQFTSPGTKNGRACLAVVGSLKYDKRGFTHSKFNSVNFTTGCLMTTNCLMLAQRATKGRGRIDPVKSARSA